MEIPFALFSFSGVIGRESYFWGKLGSFLCTYFMFRIAILVAGPTNEWHLSSPFLLFMLTIAIVFNVWSHLALDLKRLRDGGLSNLWLLLDLVPFAQLLFWPILLLAPTEDGRLMTPEEELQFKKMREEDKSYEGLLKRAELEPRNLELWKQAYQETLLHRDYENALRLTPHLLDLELKQGFAVDAFSHWIYLKKHQLDLPLKQSVALLRELGEASHFAEAGAVLKTILNEKLDTEDWRELKALRATPLHPILGNMARNHLSPNLTHEAKLVLHGFIGNALDDLDSATTQKEDHSEPVQKNLAATVADEDDWSSHSDFHLHRQQELRAKLAEPLAFAPHGLELRLHNGQLRALPFSLIAAIATAFVRSPGKAPYYLIDLRLKPEAAKEFGDIQRIHSNKMNLAELAPRANSHSQGFVLFLQNIAKGAQVPVLPLGIPMDEEDFEPFSSETEFEMAIYGSPLGD